ncbi:MAG TPA: cytochrome c peroxidase [Gammaproteobacteria bacterium]|nr:cytochrome c peroxidase [Gammaproteobacteria bacterium]
MKMLRFLIVTGVVMLMQVSVAQAYEIMPALPAQSPIPGDNPLTPAKVALGKQLYFDARLSAGHKVSCNTCHNLSMGGVDHLSKSVGALGKPVRRSTPTVLNTAFQSVQFWDGRAESLEAAVKDHLLDPAIMAMPDEKKAVEAIASIEGYKNQFAEVFPGTHPVSYDNIARAVAAYVRTLITPNSPFDRYVKGDKKALSKQALRGMAEFQRVGCVACHFGDNFSGPPVPMGEGFYELFPNYLGSEYDKKYQLVTDDQGRYEVTKESIHKLLFHMPSLRNIALTAPYFHTGTVATLEEAVRVMGKTQLNKDLSDQQVTDITVFLKSLTGKLPKQEAPALP